MVKRDDATETSLGSVRDTDKSPVPPSTAKDDEAERHEGCYRPEMGTIIVNDFRAPQDES